MATRPFASTDPPAVPSLPFPRARETQSGAARLLCIVPSFTVSCTVIITGHGRQISDRGRESSREVLALLPVMAGSFPGATPHRAEVGHYGPHQSQSQKLKIYKRHRKQLHLSGDRKDIFDVSLEPRTNRDGKETRCRPAQNRRQGHLKSWRAGLKTHFYQHFSRKVIKHSMENTSVTLSVAQCLTTRSVPFNTTGVFLHWGVTVPKTRADKESLNLRDN